MLIRLSHVVLCPYPCCYCLPFAVSCHDSAVAIPGEDASRAFGKAIRLETIWIGREKLGCLRKDAKGKTDNRIEFLLIHQQHSYDLIAHAMMNMTLKDSYSILKMPAPSVCLADELQDSSDSRCMFWHSPFIRLWGVAVGEPRCILLVCVMCSQYVYQKANHPTLKIIYSNYTHTRAHTHIYIYI